MSSDAEGHIYRRFGQLRSRLLLHLQDEICCLEDKLIKLDKEQESSNQDRIRLHSRRWDERDNNASERRELISQIDNRLERYDDVLLRQDGLLRLLRTPKSLHRQYFNWIYNEKPLVKDEYSFIYREEDFVSLGMSEDTWLAPLVKDIGRVTPTWLSRVGYISSKPHAGQILTLCRAALKLRQRLTVKFTRRRALLRCQNAKVCQSDRRYHRCSDVATPSWCLLHPVKTSGIIRRTDRRPLRLHNCFQCCTPHVDQHFEARVVWCVCWVCRCSICHPLIHSTPSPLSDKHIPATVQC